MLISKYPIMQGGMGVGVSMHKLAGPEELLPENKPKLEDITKDVISEVKEIEKETGKEIPVVVAGGIFDGKDIAKFLKLGANGVQMAKSRIWKIKINKNSI